MANSTGLQFSDRIQVTESVDSYPSTNPRERQPNQKYSEDLSSISTITNVEQTASQHLNADKAQTSRRPVITRLGGGLLEVSGCVFTGDDY
jgi:hypothetical protein